MIIPLFIRSIALRKVRADAPDHVAIVRTERDLLGREHVLLELEGGAPKELTLSHDEAARWQVETLNGANLWDEQRHRRDVSKANSLSVDAALASVQARRDFREWCAPFGTDGEP